MCELANSAETLARQNCVSILLHRQAAESATARHTAASGGCVRGFQCKSCDRAFETFQALGGHRASHKKLRLTGDAMNRTQDGGGLVAPAVQLQLKFHECRECRIRFPTGQALGGHMRKHVDLKAKRKRAEEDDHDHENAIKKQIRTFPILSKFKISKRVVFNLDLNFPPPLEEYSFLQLV